VEAFAVEIDFEAADNYSIIFVFASLTSELTAGHLCLKSYN